jgi:tight adherence protein B
MLIKLGVFLAIFAGVFLLVKLAYPFCEKMLRLWQRKRLDKITPKLDRMFLDVPLQKLMLMDILIPLGAALGGYIFSRNIVVALVCGGVGLLIPLAIIKRMEAVRRQRFANQLVDGLLILSSSLKAGLSLIQAFEELVQEMPAPISQEFGLVVRQMQVGVPLEDAMLLLKRRLHMDELDMVVTAMLVARETGGDLTVTFGRIVATIQERNKLTTRVNALCTQGKLQGLIMSLLPIFFGLFVYRSNPDFFSMFLKDNLGRALMIYAFISEVLGVFFIHKLSRVEV